MFDAKHIMDQALIRSRHPRLLVFLDTNLLFTESASAPLRGDLLGLIEATRHDTSSAGWCIPEVVFHERVAQMLQRALQLRPAVAELEAALEEDHRLSTRVTRDFFIGRVEAALSRLGIARVPLDPGTVDWTGLMLAAVYREPPFSPGKSEKGFRDALLLCTLRQECARVDARDTIVLATKDALLATAVSDALPSICVVDSVDALRDILAQHEVRVGAIRREQVTAFFAALNETAAKQLDEGSSALQRMTEAVDTLGTDIERIATQVSALTATAKPSSTATIAKANMLVAQATRTTLDTAERLRADLPAFRSHFNAAVAAIGEAASTPPVFTIDDIEGLDGAIAGLATLLSGLSSARQSTSGLFEALAIAADAGAVLGFNPTVLTARGKTLGSGTISASE